MKRNSLNLETNMQNNSAMNINLTLLLLSGFFIIKLGATGNLVTAKNGMTIYTYDRDVANSGKSECTNYCAIQWPPVPADEAVPSAAGYSSIVRVDGFWQLTYRGKPVYFLRET